MSHYYGIRNCSHLLKALALAALVGAPLGSSSAQEADPQLTREQIREIQTRLNELGFDAGPTDGLIGPQSRSGVLAFRTAHGYDTDVPLNERLLRRLREAAASEGGTDDPGTAAPGSGGGDTPDAQAGTGPEAAVDGGSTAGPAADTDASSAEPQPPSSERGASQPEGAGSRGSRLIGSRWRFEDENGATLTLTFRSGGRIARDGLIDESWQWRMEGDTVVIEYDAGVGLSARRQGHLVDTGRMRGTGSSPAERSWEWTARRIETAEASANGS